MTFLATAAFSPTSKSKLRSPIFGRIRRRPSRSCSSARPPKAAWAPRKSSLRISSDIETYLHLAKEEHDVAQRDSILHDTERELNEADEYVSKLETETLLSGESDRLNAILTIKPGAGGSESQDWAEMLLRTYLRWAERKGYGTTVIDSQPGEGAGLKSATVRVEGENAYGLLSTEIRRASADPHFAFRSSRTSPHVVCVDLRDSRSG